MSIFIQIPILVWTDMSPVDVWNLVRMKILPYFTPWDYVCDRTRVMGSKFTINGNPGENSSSSVAKLKFLLHEMNGLAEELSLLVAGCCDTIEENVETSAGDKRLKRWFCCFLYLTDTNLSTLPSLHRSPRSLFMLLKCTHPSLLYVLYSYVVLCTPLVAYSLRVFY